MVSRVKVKKYKAGAYLNYILLNRLNTLATDTFTSKSRHITISPVACSDGCSPKYHTPFGIIGAWDGPIYIDNLGRELPITFRAFFLHDVLLANRKLLGLTAYQCHQEFERELNRTDFIFKKLYIELAYRFGPQD